MRILVLCHLLPYPVDNGAKMRIFNLTWQLAQQHEVVLLCPAVQPEHFAGLQADLSPDVRVESITWPLVHGKHQGPGFFSTFPRDVQPFHSDTQQTIDTWLNTWSPDMLLATDPVLGEYLAPYTGMWRVMDIAAEHTHYIRRVMIRKPLNTRILWVLRALKWATYMRRLGQHVDQWVVPAPADRETLLQFLPTRARVAVLANGVDAQANAYNFDPDAPLHIVHSGAMSYEPNRDALIYFCRDIWPFVRHRVPGVRMSVTGKNTNVPPEVQNARDVTLTGYLPELHPLITASRVSIAPLRLGVGTRLKILEAMALGTPVVSTSLGAEGLNVTHRHDIMLADMPSAFAESVIEVLTSRELRVQLSEAGRKTAEERYSWDVIGAGLRAVLDDLVQRSADERQYTAATTSVGTALHAE